MPSGPRSPPPALAACGEWLHARRVARLGRAGIRPGRPAAPLDAARAVPAGDGDGGTRVVAGHADGIQQPAPATATAAANATRHLMVMLDVSPSMLLADAGEGGAETRNARAYAVLKSVLDRVPGDNVRFTAAGFYTEVAADGEGMPGPRADPPSCRRHSVSHHLQTGQDRPAHVAQPGRRIHEGLAAEIHHPVGDLRWRQRASHRPQADAILGVRGDLRRGGRSRARHFHRRPPLAPGHRQSLAARPAASAAGFSIATSATCRATRCANSTPRTPVPPSGGPTAGWPR